MKRADVTIRNPDLEPLYSSRSDSDAALWSDPVLSRVLALQQLRSAGRIRALRQLQAKLVTAKKELTKSRSTAHGDPYGQLTREASIAVIDLQLDCLRKLSAQAI